jgi:hypothetical protein
MVAWAALGKGNRPDCGGLSPNKGEAFFLFFFYYPYPFLFLVLFYFQISSFNFKFATIEKLPIITKIYYYFIIYYPI